MASFRDPRAAAERISTVVDFLNDPRDVEIVTAYVSELRQKAIVPRRLHITPAGVFGFDS